MRCFRYILVLTKRLLVNTHYFLLPISFVLLVAGCASDPVIQGSYPVQNNQQTVITAPTYPTQQNQMPTQPFPQRPSNVFTGSVVTGDYANHQNVNDFIQHMVRTHGFSEDYLVDLFSQAQSLDYVIRLESPAPSPSSTRPAPGSWTKYRKQFLTDAHINKGVAFWHENATAIEKASQTYGVDPEYIVGIIGVETFFGGNFGKTRILDALSTLAFDTHRRAEYFTQELENFLLMTKEEGYNPLQPKGSWAGAMGYGQFMPSSFRKLAVDFDNDGHRDLWRPTDAVGSVANYFSKNGWQYHAPVTQPASSGESDVIELGVIGGSEYWRVYPNFQVIKKYNNSNKYAMAVHQLAQAIKARY